MASVSSPDGQAAQAGTSSVNPWAAFDEMSVTLPEVAPFSIGKLAFYGRCSTEDNQDPATSLDWQVRAANALVEPLGGEIVAEYFDVGLSRSLPWKRRRQASALLSEISSPDRQWTGIVVGEGQRCFYGAQFSDVAPLLEHYGVTIYIPELGGAYDPRNSTHYTLMTVTGGMSRGERQRVQERVRLAMAAQVEIQGRYQGGRAPYGYTTIAIGPHRNPRKAAEGYQQKKLAVDPEAGPVVQRIFAEFVAGRSLRVIARELNSDGILCPAAARPEQNRHRRGDGWQTSSLSVILGNPRYTGYEFWGKFKRVESLLDPEDVSMGYQTRLQLADPTAAVRSRNPAHEALISVETFVTAQDVRAGRAPRRMGSRGTEKERPTKVVYPLRTIVRCASCNRKMEASPRSGGRLYYRCRSRDLLPGSEVAARHATNIYVNDIQLARGVHSWLTELFSPDHRDSTIRSMVGSQDVPLLREASASHAERNLKDAQTRLARLQAAIEAGADITALIEPLNRTQAEVTTIQSEIAVAAGKLALEPEVLDAEQLTLLLDSLDDVAREVFADADPSQLAVFYHAIGLTVVYNHETHTAEASVTLPFGHRPLGGGDARVRGGT